MPPLEGTDLAMKREGSAPTSADARLVNQSYDSRQNKSDYHTVVHPSSNSVNNAAAMEPGPTKRQAASSRAEEKSEATSTRNMVASPDGGKASLQSKNVEPVAEHPNENEENVSPTGKARNGEPVSSFAPGEESKNADTASKADQKGAKETPSA